MVCSRREIAQAQLEARRQQTTYLGERIRDDETPETIQAMARSTWPHWWQRAKRRQWAEGYRLAVARISNTVWHSMP